VIDGPPSFVADALVLAASADGILVVVRLGQSPWDAATKMRAQFRAASVNVEGIVLNGMPRKPSYQSSYYEHAAPTHDQPAWQTAVARIWGGLEGLKSPARPDRNGSEPGHRSAPWAGAMERIRGIRSGRPRIDSQDDEVHE
jgi:Mrp family chromosome partitioning ATPase